jgi:hypothetical protein
LRNNLSLECYERLAALVTPADLNLPLYVDVAQARKAQAQEEQISRRLGRRTAALERIERAIQVLEAPGKVDLPIGGGVVVAAIQLTGQWSAIRYIPQPGKFPGWSAASDPSELLNQTLRGVPLAAAITTWWLLLGYPPSPATRPVGGSESPRADARTDIIAATEIDEKGRGAESHDEVDAHVGANHGERVRVPRQRRPARSIRSRGMLLSWPQRHQLMEYNKKVRQYYQELLDYYRALLKNLIALGDEVHANGAPSGCKTVTQVIANPFPAEWPRLREAIQYSLDNYKTVGPWQVEINDETSANLMLLPGVTINRRDFTGPNDFLALMYLIHEPLHDWAQFGIGHAGWSDYGLGDVIGPTKVPPGGSYWDKFIDYVRSTHCDGVGLINRVYDKLTRPMPPQIPSFLEDRGNP